MARHTQTGASQAFPEQEAARHDMANLLDAAMRSASAARRGSDPRERLAAIEAALAQMGDLMAVMSPPPSLGARRRAPRDAGLSIFDAVHHAAEIMRGVAEEQGVRVVAEASVDLRGRAAPGLFRALTDAIRNALESISVARCAVGGPHGTVTVSARVETGAVLIDVVDDGAGPPAAGEDPFAAGASSKPGSLGLGLAVVGRVVERLRGAAMLGPGTGSAPGRMGATLRLTLPLESLTTLSDAETR